MQPEMDRPQYQQPSEFEGDTLTALHDLRKLKDGWLDGEGKAMPKAGLDWLIPMMEAVFSQAVSKPHVFPTPEGGVSLEWQGGTNEASLEIDLDTRRGEWVAFNTEPEADEVLDLDSNAGWERLLTLINSLNATSQ